MGGHFPAEAAEAEMVPLPHRLPSADADARSVDHALAF